MDGRPRPASTPTEVAARLAADRRGAPYLAYRDAGGAERLAELRPPAVTIGRQPGCDVLLDWDPEVSRLHARLELAGAAWTVVDDGLSRNGTFVNGGRVAGRRRLSDGDRLRFGATEARFRDPAQAPRDTVASADRAAIVALTPAQRQVLAELCRPVAAGGLGPPASNREIAQRLHVSVEAVRTHLKALFRRFDVPDLPQNRKRAELARRALVTGMVAPDDMD